MGGFVALFFKPDFFSRLGKSVNDVYVCRDNPLILETKRSFMNILTCSSLTTKTCHCPSR